MPIKKGFGMGKNSVGLSAISLFSGAGGLDLAAKWAGVRTVCYVENDPYAQGVLMSRIRDGGLDDARIWDDVKTFDGKPWRGEADCVFGGFPCQPHSIASGTQRGGADERNLWPDMLRIIREVGPSFVLAENVPGIFVTGYALEVLADLEGAGFCATPVSICACEFGAPHPRERLFFMAHAFGLRCWPWCKLERSAENIVWTEIPKEWDASNTNKFARSYSHQRDTRRAGKEKWWPTEPDIERVVNGMAFCLDRLRCCGNGVVPQQALPCFREIVERKRA